MTPTTLTVQIGFIGTTLISYSLVLFWLWKSLVRSDFEESVKRRILYKTILALAVWTVIISALSAQGFFANFDSFPPRLILVLVVPLISCLFITFTSTVKHLLAFVPKERIIYLQAFRIVVEVLLWMIFVEGKLPIQMTFEGRNLDVVSGITAPMIAFLYSRGIIGRRVAIAWNIICLGLLMNIVATAILSMPTPLRVFMNEPANTIVAEFPIIWLPGLLVPLAYGLHFLSLRQLWAAVKSTPV